MTVSNESPVGSSFEDFLGEIGIRDDVYAIATKRVIAWQLENARKASHVKKTDLAKAMKTSRAQLQRVLDPGNTSVSIDLICRAASALGKTINLELVDG